MKFKKFDLLWITALSLALGAVLSSLQSGNRWISWLGFSFLFLLSILLLKALHSWAGSASSALPSVAPLTSSRWFFGSAKKTLGWIIALAFMLRLAGGVAAYVLLPVYGYPESKDNQAGYVFTDAHKRDEQAWGLAISGKPLTDAFSRDYSSDQYGGLLALSALVYRYLAPDAQRPLMMVLFAACVAALGIPFFWRAVSATFGEKVAWASTWIFALYPESILLGGSAMREPYLMTLSAIALWGFVEWQSRAERSGGGPQTASAPRSRSGVIAIGLSLLAMLLLSPAVAIFTLVIFAGWMFSSSEWASISWKTILIFAIVFLVGLFVLSSSLNRNGVFDATSPMHVINDWLQLAVKWDAYQLERESGWVQKLFDEMPEGLRLPFVATYGILQPVLPATLIVPTIPIWKVVYVSRALGWYALLPLMILSFIAGSSPSLGKPALSRRAEPVEAVVETKRTLFLWLSLLAWTWILLASIRGGGDQWDNPRYRTIMFMWQALIAGYVWVWWRETRNAWFVRVVACELVFMLVFGQWYASRYYYLGGQLPFAVMIALIVGLWGAIIAGGWWLEKIRGQSQIM